MKKTVAFWIFLVGSFFTMPAYSQNGDQPNALGLPGDNLDLYAVLDVFQKSKTLEDFERDINNKESNINNLDLNNDKFIDYIKVVSQKEENTYYIVLQVPINEKENQDVAVINVSKDKSGKPIVQIVGDEELYGKDYVIEPTDDKVSGTPNPGYKGDATTVINNTTNVYNTTNEADNYAPVEAWPVVVYLYSPVFVVYRSPFYWGFYPSYWHPWAPIYYYNYWGYHNHYHHNHHYRRGTVIINVGYYNSYYGRRNRSNVVVTNGRRGTYNATYNGKDYRNPATPTRTPTKQGPTRQNPIQAPTRTSPTRSTTRQTSPTRSTTRQSQSPTRSTKNVKSNRQSTSPTRKK